MVGFDVSQIESFCPDVLIRDISYLDRPSPDLLGFTQMAAHRKKPRDAMALLQAVLYRGYFSKYLEWSYEQEVRAVNIDDRVEDVNGNRILYLPKHCVTAIISGAKASEPTRQALQEAASELESEFHTEKIGRSYPTPYLLADNQHPRVFANGAITIPVGVCENCAEPLRAAGSLCPWCSIDEADQMNAAANNPFRILEHHKLLEGYVERYPTRPRKPYGR